MCVQLKDQYLTLIKTLTDANTTGNLTGTWQTQGLLEIIDRLKETIAELKKETQDLNESLKKASTNSNCTDEIEKAVSAANGKYERVKKLLETCEEKLEEVPVKGDERVAEMKTAAKKRDAKNQELEELCHLLTKTDL